MLAFNLISSDQDEEQDKGTVSNRSKQNPFSTEKSCKDCPLTQEINETDKAISVFLQLEAQKILSPDYCRSI